MAETPLSFRDIFLSHKSVDKNFVRQLAGDIEAEMYQDRQLWTWVDEAEIRPGRSIPGMIEKGMEMSRFFGIILTPAYFQGESGWPDAEWHSVLHQDPDNRRARIIPLLVKDCPFIPYLIKHLSFIDFRGDRRNYKLALKKLLTVLREEPLPRPIAHRGQLITATGRIERQTLISERTVPQADPDVVNEKLYCNLLPVEHLPKTVHIGLISDRLRKTGRHGRELLPTKQELKNEIRKAQMEADVKRPFMPIFRVIEDRIVTFHDLETADNPFATIIEEDGVELELTKDWLLYEEERNIVISLLNMALDRHAIRQSLVVDEQRNKKRFFFPPKNGKEHIVTWIPLKNRAERTVAKPCYTSDGDLLFWRHLGVYLKMIYLADKFYLHLVPTWVITEDGQRIRKGSRVGPIIIKWTGKERNMAVLYHVRFWAMMLGTGRGPISIMVGDQRLDIGKVPAFIEQAYGIEDDQRDLLRQLDDEAALIAAKEEELADMETNRILSQTEDGGEEVEEDQELDQTDDDEKDC